MRGLGSAPQDRGQRVPDGANVPLADSRALVELHRDDLPGCLEGRFQEAVEVHVGEAGTGRLLIAALAPGDVLRRDQVLERRQPHMRDVDAAEQPMPVAIIRLAHEQVVERTVTRRAGGQGVHVRRRPEHLLVEVVDLAIAPLEIAPEAAAEVSGLRPAVVDRPLEQLAELDRIGRRQHPFGHLRVGARRDVDAACWRMQCQPIGRGHGRQPVGVRLERIEEALHPVPVPPAMLEGRRPRPELLAVIAHRPEPIAGRRRVRPEMLDDLLDVAERNQVAQALLGAEDGQPPALVVGRVRGPVLFVGDGRRPEMGVIDDRPRIARIDERGRQRRLPDALRQPCARGTAACHPLQFVGHANQLGTPVAIRQRREDRLVPAAADELDLAPRDEPEHRIDECGALGLEPLQQRAAVME